MLTTFVSLYLLTAGVFFGILLAAFWLDRSTSKSHRMSWLIVLVGALFWGIALPLAIVERTRRLMRQRSLSSRRVPAGRWG
jgi:hypothetical protein